MNAKTETNQAVGGGLSVLVVDDSAALRGALRAVLSSLGISRIAEAADALQAIEILRSGEITLTITDWKMEPMDGLTLIKAIRQGAVGPNADMPVIMLTAYSDPRYQAEAARAGASVFLPKPFTAATLVEALEAVKTVRSQPIRPNAETIDGTVTAAQA
ncbi:response regulator [Hyphobacterium marinum]|uniref:Response regulator n=1 Tax=Hyphobacterium marinum TaxID=3116574 RepID=A0ABU7M219_9PROT|nr:response regulator [Hyphobacterium sp. Y6023]MEE2567736.1 response regulator [Hyphobacterium sp. Y6023]